MYISDPEAMEYLREQAKKTGASMSSIVTSLILNARQRRVEFAREPQRLKLVWPQGTKAGQK